MVSKKEVEKEDLNYAFSISGFILGILSLIFMGLNGILIAIIGIIFSGYSYKNKKTRLGKIGIILNLIGIISGIILLVIIINFSNNLAI